MIPNASERIARVKAQVSEEADTWNVYKKGLLNAEADRSKLYDTFEKVIVTIKHSN